MTGLACPCEAVGQRYRFLKPHAGDLEAGLGRDPARILEDRRDEAIAARRENCGAHRFLQLPKTAAGCGSAPPLTRPGRAPHT